MLVVDLGDGIIMRPMPANPLDDLLGKYAGRGPNTDEMRRQAREEDAEAEERRR